MKLWEKAKNYCMILLHTCIHTRIIHVYSCIYVHIIIGKLFSFDMLLQLLPLYYTYTRMRSLVCIILPRYLLEFYHLRVSPSLLHQTLPLRLLRQVRWWRCQFVVGGRSVLVHRGSSLHSWLSLRPRTHRNQIHETYQLQDRRSTFQRDGTTNITIFCGYYY